MRAEGPVAVRVVARLGERIDIPLFTGMITREIFAAVGAGEGEEDGDGSRDAAPAPSLCAWSLLCSSLCPASTLLSSVLT